MYIAVTHIQSSWHPLPGHRTQWWDYPIDGGQVEEVLAARDPWPDFALYSKSGLGSSD